MGKPGVGAVLADWMNERGLNPTEMGKRAQISHATVYVVLDSRSKNPETMRQIALGLAKRSETDAHGDPEIERRAARDLLTAAGYGALIIEVPQQAAPDTSPGRTRAEMVEIVRRHMGTADGLMAFMGKVRDPESLPLPTLTAIVETIENDLPPSPGEPRHN